MELTNEQVVERARTSFATGKSKSLEYRKEQIRSLLRMFDECRAEMIQALNSDLRKSRSEAILFELDLLTKEAELMVKNLDKYAAKKKLPFNALAFLDRGYVQKEPFGVVLILGAWNYPFVLSLKPMIGAIAAGNVVLLKPSEVAPHTADVMLKRIPQYLDADCCQVIVGDVNLTIDLLSYKFDYIFCTGGTNVGRSVYKQAAPHLTPCTLELGGKSPCYIDDSADFHLASKRVLWGKLVNFGQTCIAPDYILCSKKAEKEIIATTSHVFKEWYGENIKENPDLPRIINRTHFERLKNLLASTKGNIVVGGKCDVDDLWIEPTVVVDVMAEDVLMKDEIFGPILPIVTVNTVDEAVKFILARPKPLALYMFSKNETANNTLIANVSSGGVCINDCLWQNPWQGLPFGGVGDSGMGNYHGEYSFDTFSHKKAILHRAFGWVSEKLGESRYPPYTERKVALTGFIIKKFDWFNMKCNSWITHFLAAGVGAVILFLVLHFCNSTNV